MVGTAGSVLLDPNHQQSWDKELTLVWETSIHHSSVEGEGSPPGAGTTLMWQLRLTEVRWPGFGETAADKGQRMWFSAEEPKHEHKVVFLYTKKLLGLLSSVNPFLVGWSPFAAKGSPSPRQHKTLVIRCIAHRILKLPVNFQLKIDVNVLQGSQRTSQQTCKPPSTKEGGQEMYAVWSEGSRGVDGVHVRFWDSVGGETQQQRPSLLCAKQSGN